MAETLFIVGATTTPALAEMLPPPQDLKARLVDQVLAELDKVVSVSPALAVKVSTLRMAEDKRQELAFGG